MNMMMSSVASPVTGSESSGAPLGCGQTGESQHDSTADKSAQTTWCSHVNVYRGGFSNILQNLWVPFESERRPSVSVVFLIKCLMNVLSTSICKFFLCNSKLLCPLAVLCDMCCELAAVLTSWMSTICTDCLDRDCLGPLDLLQDASLSRWIRSASPWWHFSVSLTLNSNSAPFHLQPFMLYRNLWIAVFIFLLLHFYLLLNFL